MSYCVTDKSQYARIEMLFDYVYIRRVKKMGVCPSDQRDLPCAFVDP